MGSPRDLEDWLLVVTERCKTSVRKMRDVRHHGLGTEEEREEQFQSQLSLQS